MSILAFGSAKASPGVTTSLLAMAAVWPADRSLLLVEADPDGGVLSTRCGLAAEPGLSTLAVAGRRSMPLGELARHVQRLPGGDVDVLVGPPSAEQSRRALELGAGPLAVALRELPGTDVLVDLGRLTPAATTWPLVDAADRVVLVARPRLEELQLLPARLRALTGAGVAPSLVLVGERPYSPTEVTTALDVDVLAVLADDPRAAAALTGEPGVAGLRRSLLLRSAQDAVAALLAACSGGHDDGEVRAPEREEAEVAT